MEELEKVRAALRLLGAAVVERPMPEILTGGERSFYSPSKHTVVLATGAPQTTLWHELAHSQQPAVKAISSRRSVITPTQPRSIDMLKFREIHVYYVRDDGRYYVKSREPGRILELDEWPNGDWVSETHEVEYELIEETT